MPTLHATCLAAGEGGILIRGPSGSGKSTLAREILRLAALEGRFARLVADDRVAVEARHGRLIARSVPATAGLIEIRGTGLVTIPYESAIRLVLVVDCNWDEPPRWPEEADRQALIEGIGLPRLAGQAGPRLAALALAAAGGALATASIR